MLLLTHVIGKVKRGVIEGEETSWRSRRVVNEKT